MRASTSSRRPSSSNSSRRHSSRRGSASFLMFKDLECKEEFQKVKLAGFLRELHQLATEDHKEQVRDSMSNVVQKKKSNQQQQQAHKNDKCIVLPEDDLSESLTPTQAHDAIAALLYSHGKKLDSGSFMRLIQAGVSVMSQEDTVVDLCEMMNPNPLKKVTVVGDLHGSLNCLKKVLELIQYQQLQEEPHRAIVFDGDYVDRGEHSLEVLTTLLLLKLAHPKQIVLLRGNHEDTMTASTYGFREEIDDKYYEDDNADAAEEIWYELGLLFAALPICAKSKTAVILHGGIPTEDLDLEQVNELSKEIRCQLKTIADPYDDDERLVQGILWSDPSWEPGIQYSDRGAGFTFGPDITKDFLERHDLKYIIRAHEPFEEGTCHLNIDADVDENGNCEEGEDAPPVTDGSGRGVITVFSTANYPNGEGTNTAAVLHLDDDSGAYEASTFIHSDPIGGGGGFSGMDNSANSLQSIGNSHEAYLKTLLEDNKRNLVKEFKAAQDDTTLTVTIEQWADILAEQLDLPDVPWIELQPELAPTNASTGTIDWFAFLNRFFNNPNDISGDKKMFLPPEMLDKNQWSILQKHKDKCINIFHLLDTDGSGTISLNEFTSGMKLLKEELGTMGHDADSNSNVLQEESKNAHELFHIFDMDGDGEMSIVEFCQALQDSETLQGVTEKLGTSQLESLQSNHDMLLVAFKYLDTDKSGAIDREEFQRGVELLNKRNGMNKSDNKRRSSRSQQQLLVGDPQELFDLLDLDGNGEIDLDEFHQMFRSI